ncbi:MAG: hypothetical protein H5T86_14705, partial [Armatimonadetes bacterium]|nr:hypothetical protein [Armatimonadota bacterium]
QMRRLTQPGWKVRWVERELNGKWGPYTNGGAQETWALSSVFPEQDPPVIVSPQLTVDGHPLQLLAGPWGNRRRGVWATWASSVYISLPDGSDPNATTHRIVLRYGLLEPAPGAPPLLKLDDSDWLIFYGGGSKPYTHSYNSTRAFPWNMALHETDGYAFWCYQWYPETERLGWLDDRLRWTPSPAFEGLRDGNEDMALYFAALQVLKRSGHRKAASKLAERLFGDGRILEVSRKVYAWPLNTCTETVAADNSYRRFQEARAILLQIITGS